MGLLNIGSVDAYVDMLRMSADEAFILVRNLLIGVTSFFRDPEAFEIVKTAIIPTLIEQARPDQPIRIWVPGCSSGEEAYSLAMLVMDAVKASTKQITLQIFATDMDERAIEFARAGVYPMSAVNNNVPQALVDRFFTRRDDFVTVNKSVRETVIFAVQNLISDPPFSRLDLVSCRNLLIYFNNPIQTSLVKLFHFALKAPGFLFLGGSETIGDRSDLFQTVSKKWRLYRKLEAPAIAYETDFIVGAQIKPTFFKNSTLPPRNQAGSLRLLSEQVQSKLIDEYAPAAVLINRQGEALYFHGPVSRYLTLPSGIVTHELISMTKDGLRMPLRALLQKALHEGSSQAERHIRFQEGKDLTLINLKIGPLNLVEGTFLVCFEEESEKISVPAPHDGDEILVKQLEYELRATREDLQTTIDEVETANEDLKAANEEMMAMNEELQSTNEEMETSKEELQSLNEELSTVNSQLLDKIHELELSNNDLSNLLTSTDIATIFVDANLRLRRFTPSAKRIFSLIESDIGRNITDLNKHYQNGDLATECRQVLATLTPFYQEIYGNDGKWYQLRILLYRATENRIDGLVITFTDISERKQAEKTLLATYETFRHLVETSPFGVYVVDADFKLVTVSTGARRYFRNINPLIGRDFGEIMRTLWPEPFADETVARFRHVLKSGESYRSANTVEKRKDIEAEVTHDWFVERLILPDLRYGVVCYFYDLSERQRYITALHASEQRFRAVFEHAATGIVIADDQLRILQCNPAYRELAGHSEAELTQMTLTDLVHDDDKISASARLKALHAAPESFVELEICYKRKDGQRVWVKNLFSRLSNAYDPHFYIVGLVTDFTERRKFEEALLEADRRKNEFLAMLCHELRNPLSPISNVAELLKTPHLDEKTRRSISAILDRNLLHIIRLVDDLLDVSRITQGMIRVQTESLELLALIREVVETENALRQSKQQQLYLELPAEPVNITGDRVRLTQVFSNLLHNAIKYTPPHGRIDLTVTSQTKSVRIAVKDNGIGIGPDLQPFVFDLFVQGQRSLARSEGGLGIGLTLVKKLVELHRGTISVISGGANQGTEFIVELPLAPEKIDNATATTETAAASSLPAHAFNILLIEDNSDAAYSLRLWLETKGQRVQTAASGAEGLKMIEEQSDFDIIFIDVGLPDLNGYEVARQIRQSPGADGKKIIGLSGYAQDFAQMSEQGQTLFDDYLTKPPSLPRLKELLAGLAPKNR